MSERTVYAIASGKGGVGKTTTAINLGAMLADRDHEVVVVDTDLGMANLADFLDFEIEKPTLHEVLADDADFEDAIYRAPGGIDVLPSGVDIEAFAKSDPTNLQHVVADLREEYDYVLLDTGAGVSYDTLVPLALADGVLLVATPDVASVRDTAKTGELAERVESEVDGAVLTQRSSDILNADDVEETLSTDVLAVVPADEAVPMGIDAGRPLAAFAPNAPAGQAYRELAAVLTGEADPDPELDLDGDDEQDDELDATDSEAAAEVDADAFAAPELAENVREAARSGDQSEGLLGGELATAAEEIRKQAGAEKDAADAREAEGDDATGTDPEAAGAESVAANADANASAGETTATANASEATETADASEAGGNEARSVEDLINEHISDERLGGGGSVNEGEDPLAEMGEEFTDESEGGSSDGGRDDHVGSADDESVADERDPLADETGESESRNDGGGAGAEAGDADSEVADSEEDEWADEESRANEAEGSRGDGAESGVPFGSDEPESNAGGDEAFGSEESGGDRKGDDRKDGSGGLFGRIGSLFK